MYDIDGKGWSVTGDQLRKMQQYPERYNLSPGELKLIQRLKVQKKTLPIGLDVAHHVPQGELIKEGWVSPKHTDVNKDEKKINRQHKKSKKASKK